MSSRSETSGAINIHEDLMAIESLNVEREYFRRNKNMARNGLFFFSLSLNLFLFME